MKRFFTTVVLTSLPALGAAGQADYFNIYNVPNSQLTFGTWSIGMGTQSRTATFCIASANYNNAYNDPPPVVSPPAVHENYEVKTLSRYSTPGYYFFLDRNGSNTGNARLAFTMEHIDTLDGNTWLPMSHNTFDSHSHDGQFRNCKNGKNSQLRVTIPASELENARAGPYRAKLRIEGYGGSSQTATDADNFRADITVSDIVRVSSVNDIDFGIHVPGQNREGTSEFCVYSNNDAASYSLTVSSPNQVGNNFYLSGQDGVTDTIAYDLYFNDVISGGNGTSVGAGAIAGNGSNSANDCGGADNAKLTVVVNDMEIVQSTTGEYQDTLTILVAPN